MIILKNEHHSTAPYRKGFFRIDDSMTFEGFKTENYWNGWECPCFTKEVADSIFKVFARDTDILSYNEKEDTYYLRFEECEEEETETYQGRDITVDGKVYHVYDIGAFGWCWDEYEETENEDE